MRNTFPSENTSVRIYEPSTRVVDLNKKCSVIEEANETKIIIMKGRMKMTEGLRLTN